MTGHAGVDLQDDKSHDCSERELDRHQWAGAIREEQAAGGRRNRLDAIAAAGFCRVERLVGKSDQRFDAAALFIKLCDTEGAGDGQADSFAIKEFVGDGRAQIFQPVE